MFVITERQRSKGGVYTLNRNTGSRVPVCRSTSVSGTTFPGLKEGRFPNLLAPMGRS